MLNARCTCTERFPFFPCGFGGSRRKAVAGNLRHVSETRYVAWADFTGIASASDCACRGSSLSPQADCLAPRRICHTENAALPHGDDFGRLQGIAMDVLLVPQPWPRPPARNAPQAPGGCCHTKPASSKSSFASGVQTTGSVTVS